MRWVACELHTHTVHSDGRMTVADLARAAKGNGLECIALTDHNTISGQRDIPLVERETGIRIVPGMEWTTFWGHMVAMGVSTYVEWRNLSRLDILKGIDAIHAAGGLAGVAHPFRPGSPFCTGCHWDYQMPDWSRADYLEVWSGTEPPNHWVNRRAFELWTGFLNSGIRLTAVSGRDWHSPDRKALAAITWLAVDSRFESDPTRAVMDAISSGRAASSLGPRLDLVAGWNGAKPTSFEVPGFAPTSSAPNGSAPTSFEELGVRPSIGIGGTLSREKAGKSLDISVTLESGVRVGLWEDTVSVHEIVVVGNAGELARFPATASAPSFSATVSADNLAWIRAEAHGSLRGEDAMLAFTNPIYIVDGKEGG
jgi:predicted metal-dependent phosphoesterase TrpH